MFLTKYRRDGGALNYSTYLGGFKDDHGYGLAIDGYGAAVIAGATYGNDFPSCNLLASTISGDATVTRVALDQVAGTATILYGQRYGGSGADVAYEVALDPAGAALLTGQTASSSFTQLSGILSGTTDAFLLKVCSDHDPAQRLFGELSLGPESLTYFLHVPSCYDHTPWPMLLMAHGCFTNHHNFANQTKLSPVAFERQFLLLYPQSPSYVPEEVNSQLPQRVQTSSCWETVNRPEQLRTGSQATLLHDLVYHVNETYIQAPYNISANLSRVWVGGHSSGGTLTTLLLALYPDTFEAGIVHSSWQYKRYECEGAGPNAEDSAIPETLCRFHNTLVVLDLDHPSRDPTGALGRPNPNHTGLQAYHNAGLHAKPTRVMTIHGTLDPLVPISNANDTIQSVLQAYDLSDNGLNDSSADGVYNNADASRNWARVVAPGLVPPTHGYTIWCHNSTAGVEVAENWQIDGMLHNWSNSDYSPLGPNVAPFIADFLLATRSGCQP